MKKFLTIASLAIVSMLFFSSCETEPITQESQWILPLIKTRVSAEQISSLENVKLNTNAQLTNAPFLAPFDGFPLPPIGPGVIGPVPLTDTDDFFVRAKSDTAVFIVYIENGFPINIKAGTEIKVTNTTNTDTVFVGVVAQDIPPGGSDSIEVAQNTTTEWIDNDLELFFTNFMSDGSASAVSFGASSIDVSFKIVVLHLNEVELNANKQYPVDDTLDFSMGSSGEEDIANIKEGKLTLFLESGVPVDFNFQAYFMDENYVIIDSLIQNNTQVDGADVDLTTGYVVKSSITESKLVTQWTEAGLDRLSNDAKYIYINALFSTPSSPPIFRLVHDNQIGLQLTADVVAEYSIEL